MTSLTSGGNQDWRVKLQYPGKNQSKSSAREKELMDFYSSIPRSMLLRVFLRYRLDYEMFGYDINTSLKLGGHKLASENELELLPDARGKHS